MISRIFFVFELLWYRVQIIGKDAIILDNSEHDNIGDQAIVLAEYRFLADIGIVYYELPIKKLDGREKWYAKVTPPSKTILVHGGGFLGCIWINEEQRFRRQIKAFAKHKIVVFPQSVYFGNSTDVLRASQESYNQHKDLTIFVREGSSYDVVKRFFPRIHTCLVPDMALYLRRDSYSGQRRGAAICFRTDREQLYCDECREQIANLVKKKFDNNVSVIDTVYYRNIKRNERAEIVEEKLNEISQAEVLITDRLHGMIMAAICGTPCIALNNSSGKVREVYMKWLKNTEYVMFADSASEAEELLMSMTKPSRGYNYKTNADEYKKIREIICRLID